jgi:hypothetical protein
MIQKTYLRLGLAVFCVLGGAASAMATITGISADGCAGTTCQPSFIAPLVAGKHMNVTVKGQYLDLSTGVEISGSGVHVSYGDRSGGNNTFIVVKFNVDDSAALGDRTVKIHYAIETNGPDVFKVTVVRGGHVDQIQQRVPFLHSTHLIAADSIAVNQRVTLVFTGSRLGNATIAPIAAVKDPQALPGCSETKCEFELEFTRTGNIDVNLFDGSLGATTANSLALSGTLFHFFYSGAKQVTVTGQANPSPPPNIPRIPSGGIAANPGFVDVAPRANLLNIFRSTGNSINYEGQTFLQVENHWCTDNGVQVPVAASIAKTITVPDLTWGVSNVGTAPITVAFTSQLSANNQVLDAQTIAAGTLNTGATRDFNFHRTTGSTVKLFRFAVPNPPGCFIKHSTVAGEYFEDPQFTVTVDTGHVTGETQTNQSNNSRPY